MGTLDKSTVKRAANNIDVAVGEKIRLRRRALGLSQTNLAQKLGISFQQFQKHEKGKNRIGASRLSLIAQALDVSVGFFFDEAEPERADAISSFSATSDLTGFVLSPEGQVLNKAFARIENPAVRKRILGLLDAISYP
ncbi:helix-turn-helix transcriptional regulator [Agrobacterium genomosp. 3]|nr:helix-turn-helix transcriptional regulator [Agrobacterium tomkonis]MCA1878862.1 helix-turn-helix transcriptional regulator [Agrobacterium tumefaciens]MCA1894056.1 helix-turn-helix transcriptional regulator [Agrobacterium tomkonis]